MKKLIGALLFVAASLANAQSAHDTITAFSKLDAKIEIGMNFRDYSTAVGDLNFSYKEFADGRDAEKFPTVKAKLGAALTRYVEANMIWGSNIGSDEALYHKDLVASITSRYPEAAESEHSGGATIVTGGGLRVRKLLPIYWRKASSEVMDAKKALSVKRGK